jgi:hypothetical protein
VQPVQLSLIPETVPAPPPRIIEALPEQQLAVALAALARLIAKAADPGRAGDAKQVGSDD